MLTSMRCETDEEYKAAALKVACRIADAREDAAREQFLALRATKGLFAAVHGLNLLLAVPEHRDLALRALRRLGLEWAG